MREQFCLRGGLTKTALIDLTRGAALNLLYNKFAGPISTLFAQATQVHSKKYLGGGESLTTLYLTVPRFEPQMLRTAIPLN